MPKAKDKKKKAKHDSGFNKSQITNLELSVTNTGNESRIKEGNNARLTPPANVAKTEMLHVKTSTPQPKIMPSFAELEKLCEDADDEELCLNQDDDLDAFLMIPDGIQSLAVKIEKCLNDLKASTVGSTSLADISPADGVSPPKRKKLFQTPSHSTWSTQTNESTERVIDTVETHSNCSVDSNKTLNYDISNISPVVKKQHRYHYIPSTSKNESVFLHNDEVFYKSLMGIEPDEENLNYYCAAPDAEYEIPCETIILQDNTPSCDFNAPLTENINMSGSPTYLNYFNTVNFSESFVMESDEAQVVDVDEVIAENKIVLERHRAANVEPRGSMAPNQLYNFEIIDEQEQTVQKSGGKPKKSRVGQKKRTDDIIVLDHKELNNVRLEKKKAPLRKRKNLKKEEVSRISNDTSLIELEVNESEKSIIALSSNVSMSQHRPIHCSTSSDDSVIFIPECMDDDNNNNFKNKKKKKKTNKSAKSRKNPPTGNNKPIQETSNAGTDNLESNDQCTGARNKMVGDCPICMDNLSTTVIAATICGHIFCMECIKMSIKRNGKKCPKCRRPLGSKYSYHQLFL